MDKAVVISGGGNNKLSTNERCKYYISDRKIKFNLIDKSEYKEYVKLLGLKVGIRFRKDKSFEQACKDTILDYINSNPSKIVSKLIDEFNLKQPFEWSSIQLIKLLAKIYHKKMNEKIPVSMSMKYLIDKYKLNRYFRNSFSTTIKNDIDNVDCLLAYMLDLIDKKVKSRQKWKPVNNKIYNYPSMDNKLKKEINGLIKNINKTNIKSMVKDILIIENKLCRHIQDIELYYINISKGLLKFIKPLKEYYGVK